MEFEVLKRSHLKRNMVIVLLVVAIISAIVLNFTRAKYKTEESIPLINGTINYKIPDFNTLIIFLQMKYQVMDMISIKKKAIVQQIIKRIHQSK